MFAKLHIIINHSALCRVDADADSNDIDNMNLKYDFPDHLATNLRLLACNF